MTGPNSVREMTANFTKLEKFEGVDFRRWRKKMHFLLTTLKVVHVLTTTMPEPTEDESLEQTRRRLKWENDDYVCRGHILNGMTDSLFDIYQNVESSKELWDSLESKYMAEDASSKKFLVSNFNNYKMLDSRPVMEQYNELLRILGQFQQHQMHMDEAISVSSVIDKLPPSWKDFKHTLKHQKEELSLVQLGSHLRIEESLRIQEMEKNKEKSVAGLSSINMVEGGQKFKGKRKMFQGESSENKKQKLVCWKCGKPGHYKKDCRSGKKVFKAGTSTSGSKSGPSGSKDPSVPQGMKIFNSNISIQNYISDTPSSFYVQDDEYTWWVDSGATNHVCKDRRWFTSLQKITDGSVIRMGNGSSESIEGIGNVRLTFTSGKQLDLVDVLYVPTIRKNLMSGTVINNLGYKQVIEANKYILSKHGVFVGFGYLCNGMLRLNIESCFVDNSAYVMTSNELSTTDLWHERLGHVHYKRLIEMSKNSLIPAFTVSKDKCKTCMLTKITRQPFNNVVRESKLLELIHSDICDFHSTPSIGNKKYVITFIDDSTRYCYVYLLSSKDEALEKFKVYKTEVEVQKSEFIKIFRSDRGGEYYDPSYFESVGIIHQITAPYTPQQNGISERKNRVLKEMVNSLLSYSGLNEGFWGEAMITACYILNRVPNKKSKATPYELWFGKPPNLNYLKVWGCRAVVKLTDPKRRTLGEKGIDCIFIGYANHSKAYRFYVLEPNKFVSVNSVIESRDAIFDENRFTSITRPKDLFSNSKNRLVISENQSEEPSTQHWVRRSVRPRNQSNLDKGFQIHLIEGSRDELQSQYPYCSIIEEDPKTFKEAMSSRDVSFWKEAIDDEMDSILQNNTWELTDLPPGCKPLGCRWIFKRKMKVDGSIDKFKARLVIQGFRQKEGIDYFDTYAPVARISTIRLLVAMASIHKLLIHQMDVKTAFLNGDLDEEIYMKQPEGYSLPGNEHKVCKLIKSLYGLKQAPKQWHQKFDDIVLSNGFLLNQADKCVYSKFDKFGKGIIICLYVDDMLLFGTSQDQIDETKKFLSSKFSMKDLGEAEVILGIRIIKEAPNRISITQSHYIEKVLKRFNYGNCTPVSTPMDPNVKLLPNRGKTVSQLEYSKVIGCLMYAMISTRPDIAFAVGRLSRFTHSPSIHHWQAVRRLLKYLKGTINYGLCYSDFPSILEGYSDASWIANPEDHSSTSGWIYLLGGGAISWASKKQTCITSSTMESEFVALAAAGKEAEWLRDLVYEIPLWPKPISPISIRCDSAATLAKVYSQVYNGKSRHLGVRHSMVRELITHGVISVEFVGTQQNLADHLTKGLAKDLVIKSAKGVGLKSI